jgi:DNA-binding response OmpR family regulator
VSWSVRKYRYHWPLRSPLTFEREIQKYGKGQWIKTWQTFWLLMTSMAFGICCWEILNDEGHNVELAENARRRAPPDCVSARPGPARYLDARHRWRHLLKEWSSTGALTMPVIMMSGHATIDTAVEATKIGALAFLEKPITLQKLLKAVEQGLVRNNAQAALAMAVPPVATVHTLVEVFGPMCDAVAGSTTGLLARQSFVLDKPLREARDEFEKPISNTTWRGRTDP